MEDKACTWAKRQVDTDSCLLVSLRDIVAIMAVMQLPPKLHVPHCTQRSLTMSVFGRNHLSRSSFVSNELR